MKSAAMIGATGLVGGALLDLLLEDDRFSEVRSFVRRSSGRSHDKLREHVVDFRAPESFESELVGDVLFSTLGTTRKKAGSQEAQREVDYTFQYEAARSAAKNGVACYVLVSSTGADAGSSLFYNRMKGQLDQAVKELGFARCHILRPSILDGNRQESRPAERLGLAVMHVLDYLPGLRAYRPIHAKTVAQAMVHLAFSEETGSYVHEAAQLFELAAHEQKRAT
jgi:uncharacterized protein YbjT (DUF2867 family)